MVVKNKTKSAKPYKGSKSQAIIDIKTKHPDMTPSEIGQMVDCTPSNVVQTLQRYKIDPKAVENYKERRADIFAGLQERILNSITDEAIKKTPAIQLVTAASILYDKERLERGQSTSNESIIVTQIRDMRERLSSDDINRD